MHGGAANIAKRSMPRVLSLSYAIIENIRVVKFSRFEGNPRKQRNYFTYKISQYMVYS